jgi:hypothetical protein
MYAWDNGLVDAGRIRREMGSWGIIVTRRVGGKNGREWLETNECGTFPLEEDVRMSSQLGSVGLSCGVTINMNNFASARIDCWCSVPCKEEELDACYQKCHTFVSKKVEEYAAKKIEERDKSK